MCAGRHHTLQRSAAMAPACLRAALFSDPRGLHSASRQPAAGQTASPPYAPTTFQNVPEPAAIEPVVGIELPERGLTKFGSSPGRDRRPLRTIVGAVRWVCDSTYDPLSSPAIRRPATDLVISCKSAIQAQVVAAIAASYPYSCRATFSRSGAALSKLGVAAGRTSVADNQCHKSQSTQAFTAFP